MMIHKHTVAIDGQTHSVSLTGPILHVDYQQSIPGHLAFWALHRPDETGQQGYPAQLRIFRVYATGEEIPDDASYHGSTLLFEGEYVYHLIELTS